MLTIKHQNPTKPKPKRLWLFALIGAAILLLLARQLSINLENRALEQQQKQIQKDIQTIQKHIEQLRLAVTIRSNPQQLDTLAKTYLPHLKPTQPHNIKTLQTTEINTNDNTNDNTNTRPQNQTLTQHQLHAPRAQTQHTIKTLEINQPQLNTKPTKHNNQRTLDQTSTQQ